MTMDNIHENLIFLVCSPRSGSTLLQRMIGSHSRIFTHPEPHLITPLNYLGYYDTVDKAPYDHINAAQAVREFCEELPRGEEDYLDACRAYASTIYQRVLGSTDAEFFLDQNFVDRKLPYPFPKHFGRGRTRLVRMVRELDPAQIGTLGGPGLHLDDDRSADFARDARSVVFVVDGLAARDRDSRRRKQGLAFILVQSGQEVTPGKIPTREARTSKR